ncbi:MAG TPA: hypothetical protein PK255_03610 [Candidatus Pacearchaeota archaeon]|nr:hypothetical protein [Candidatus Pacearchaeota archaeon]HQI57581.1 hypothetical protein [Candidatus Pacearchaeota archaeon]HQJ58145.1 hypothetical protein [Candidatus Pacearchaeota archaeon]
MSSNRINLAGEFYAMHRLFLEGYEATLTLGNTKGVDILLLNPKNGKQFKVEVKTTGTVMNERLYGGININWWMDKKHEEIKYKDLIYCFVFLPEDKKLKPKTFFVDSEKVAEYVKWEHNIYLKAEHKNPVKDTNIRSFRILLNEDSPYEDNFKLFD